MKNILRLVTAAAIVTGLGATAAQAGSARYEGASERYIERVIDRYVTAYGDALDGDATARKRVDLMARVYPYQIMDKAELAATAKWGMMLTEN